MAGMCMVHTARFAGSHGPRLGFVAGLGCLGRLSSLHRVVLEWILAQQRVDTNAHITP